VLPMISLPTGCPAAQAGLNQFSWMLFGSAQDFVCGVLPPGRLADEIEDALSAKLLLNPIHCRAGSGPFVYEGFAPKSL
jgi:hypothetical protein